MTSEEEPDKPEPILVPLSVTTDGPNIDSGIILNRMDTLASMGGVSHVKAAMKWGKRLDAKSSATTPAGAAASKPTGPREQG